MKDDILGIPPVEPIRMDDMVLGGDKLFLIAGPCVIESRKLIIDVAKSVLSITQTLGIPYIFKSSYDKANRSSVKSFRGPGLEEGIKDLAALKKEVGVPVLTDIHEVHHADIAAQVADILQIPAFLCRQTDILIAAGRTGRVVNIKKGQFVAPDQMIHPVEKVRSTGNKRIILTERGTSFGYGNLVVDMRAIPIMRRTGCPVVFDATHSVQLPGGAGEITGGQREFIFTLAKAAIASGANGLFIETHPKPDSALSDATNMLPLDHLEGFLTKILDIFYAINRR